MSTLRPPRRRRAARAVRRRGLDRADAFLDRTPAESVPGDPGRRPPPLTLDEGLHWVASQDPDVLERNACFMTTGSRLRKRERAYDARTPALWISNGTGRDGASARRPKLGWCWWGNRHTWLGHRVVRSGVPARTTV